MSAINQNVPALWLARFPFPERDANKYSRGSALIYGGALMTGAARLAARAAQRMGAGLVTLATRHDAVPIYASALESVIVKKADDIKTWRDLLNDPKLKAILIGPGLGIGALQSELVLTALDTRKPCVLDADGLTNFSSNPELLFAKLHSACVLTPHEGEFGRLFGKRINGSAEKVTRAAKASEIAQCVVLLKGADTIIVAPDGEAILNNNAPPYLATAGAGDVLAGMILGLIVQGMSGFIAAAAGAWISGRIATSFGPGLIAEDLVAGIPKILKSLSADKGIV